MPTAPPEPAALSWFAAQLHVHGWSNHNSSSEPASVQYYSAWARSIGLDAVWWSDHNRAFDQREDLTVDFAGATVDANLDVRVPFVSPAPWQTDWYVGWLVASQDGPGQPVVAVQDGWLRMALQGSPGDAAGHLQYQARSVNRTAVKGHLLNRPVASDPVLSFDARLCDDSPNSYAEVKVGLSWHDSPSARGPHELIYRLVPTGRPGGSVASSRRFTVTVPMTDEHVELPLLPHALNLPDGADNALQELSLAVGAAGDARACLEIRNITVHSRQPDPAVSFEALRQAAHHNGTRHDMAQIVGWEQNGGLQHFNPFLPASSALLPGREDLLGPAFVPLIHDAGGLVSLNHPFGTSYSISLPPDQQEERWRTVLHDLLAVQAWGVDTIEIYRARAGMELAHYLRLWDLLAANGVPICGVMTSDGHGGPFMAWQAAAVSWIEAAAPERDLLLDGLRRCRVFFGNLRQFDGVVDLRLGDAVMGETARPPTARAPLTVVVDPLPVGAVVKLVHVLRRPGDELAYVVDHQPIDPTQPVWIDSSRPSFVRVEVWSAAGEPLAFSNRLSVEPAGARLRAYLPLIVR